MVEKHLSKAHVILKFNFKKEIAGGRKIKKRIKRNDVNKRRRKKLIS